MHCTPLASRAATGRSRGPLRAECGLRSGRREQVQLSTSRAFHALLCVPKHPLRSSVASPKYCPRPRRPRSTAATASHCGRPCHHRYPHLRRPCHRPLAPMPPLPFRLDAPFAAVCRRRLPPPPPSSMPPLSPSRLQPPHRPSSPPPLSPPSPPPPGPHRRLAPPRQRGSTDTPLTWPSPSRHGALPRSPPSGMRM